MDKTTQRVEALADAVFSIAMTLLVLNVAVQSGLGHQEFLAALRGIGPKVLAYVVSFMVIAVYWIGHHNQFFWIKHTDRTFIWINVFFLMTIAFVPFSTSLIAAYPNERYAVMLYGVNVVAAGLALLIHWRYASGGGRLTDGPVDAQISGLMQRRILLGTAFYAIAVLLALVSPLISVVLFALLPFLYMRGSRVDRLLKSKRGAE
jgi:uncharacterized membrane protein